LDENLESAKGMRGLTQKMTPLIHLWYVCEPALLAEIISGVQALEKRQGYNSEISLGVLFLRPSKFRSDWAKVLAFGTHPLMRLD
jgi:hypothetical protein